MFKVLSEFVLALVKRAEVDIHAWSSGGVSQQLTRFIHAGRNTVTDWIPPICASKPEVTTTGLFRCGAKPLRKH